MEDAGVKKFVIGKFLKYIMVDTKTVMKQVEELQVLIHELHLEGCSINEHFQVGVIIEKLPPSWKGFKIYLKHKQREMTMEDMILRLWVEEDHRKGNKNEAPIMEAKANMVEGKTSTLEFQKFKGKKRVAHPHAPKGKDFKNIKGSCWVCGKLGHKAMDCRFKKDQNAGSSMQKKEANFMEIDDDNLVAVMTEVNMVSIEKGWWIDTGATRHICSDINLFSKYNKVVDGKKLFMGNATSSKVEGKGIVKMKFTSGKSITLVDVLHVLDIRKNLVSGPLLNTKGFKLMFESDMFVLTKGGMYVGKGYLADGLFKLNVMVTNDKNKYKVYDYMVDSYNLWHSRLGHVNSRSLHRMVYLGIIPRFQIDFKKKCKVCVESKFAKQSYKYVQERSNELLGLIHSDLCDFKSIPTRGGKNYFVTFIDDCSKFCYVYLIHSR